MSNDDILRTLQRMLGHHESLMQEWSIRNGPPASSDAHGVPLGYEAEVRSLRAAIDAIRQLGQSQRHEPPSSKTSPPPMVGDMPKARG